MKWRRACMATATVFMVLSMFMDDHSKISCYGVALAMIMVERLLDDL